MITWKHSEVSTPLLKGPTDFEVRDFGRTESDSREQSMDVALLPSTNNTNSTHALVNSGEKKTTTAGEYLTNSLNDFDPEQYDGEAAVADGANKLLMLGNVSQVPGKKKPDESKCKNEFAVALMAYWPINGFFSWPDLESHFGTNKRKEVMNRMFVSAVKLVLDIYDEEDFERIWYREEIFDEHIRLYRELRMSKEKYSADFGRLKSRFRHLWEYDFYDALVHASHPTTKLTRMKPMSSEHLTSRYFEEEGNCFFEKALELIKGHVPLKGHLKAQLLMEHSRVKCFHVADTLLLRAIHEVDIPGLLDDGKLDEKKSKLLHSLSYTMLKGFNHLIVDKAAKLLHARRRYISPALNKFETCKHEVVEVIKHADIERRLQKERVIKPEHFWTALLLSRVRDCCQSMLAAPMSRLGWSSKFFTYELCHLSRHLAKEIHRVDGEWGLEYLAFAFFFGPSMENAAKQLISSSHLFERLRSCESQCQVQSWKNIDVFMVLMGERSRYGENIICEGYDAMYKLREGVLTGRVQLPTDEELRSIS